MSIFLLSTSKGLHDLLADEIRQICPHITPKVKPGQVRIEAGLEDAYRLCLWSRLANRVLLLLAEDPISDAEDLYQLARSIDWSQHMQVKDDFVVDFIGTNRQINNSQFGALKIKDAIVDHFVEQQGQRPNVNKLLPQIRVQTRLWRDKASIFLDLSGGSLHQRHYRLQTGDAPLKEHLASAILMRSGWSDDREKTLLDPMCGSGTIAIEAAMMAANIAPGLQRKNWGFSHWLGHNTTLWQALGQQAKEAKIAPLATIYACDSDPTVLAKAKENANQAGVYDFIEFQKRDALKLKLQQVKPGYMVCNPPYGERLSDIAELLPLFQQWGSHLKQYFAGWQLSLLSSNRDLLRQMKLVASREYQFFNGKLECQLVNYVMDDNNCVERKSKPLAEDFANRLSKNIKQLNKWLKSQSTDCYRLYDADLPEYNVAIDRYGDYLVVQEYSPPKDIPEQKARKRLQDVILTLPSVTGIPIAQIEVKERSRQKGKAQYQKLDSRRQKIKVRENGAQFWVNLWDYLDTGLFLDHRETRQRIKHLAKGKHVLNLFCYTGSVSVFAALGGARSVTSVDMSRTYLDWAKQNVQLNNLSGAQEFIQADCLQWLAEQGAEQQPKWDLMFIDPPSFSNSKRMQTSWDVQRDHLRMLSDAAAVLNPGGSIVFSNNLRGFKLDQAGIENSGFKVSNWSSQTLPEDFKRNPKIHQCWLLQRQS